MMEKEIFQQEYSLIWSSTAGLWMKEMSDKRSLSNVLFKLIASNMTCTKKPIQFISNNGSWLTHKERQLKLLEPLSKNKTSVLTYPSTRS